ncbi:uncharacterized protein BX663DRAFT_495407 [Cokeromyces recurvatus]|uniref:uncharacterized protein n=1 Tax=Cokeromyces recurvatus TaxID=90255 RepID=UPI00221EAAF0|nr:uncharacterized protein BX663DRAFT_495407 [Cokeromyces recurvatus]KAI7907280.1 hypothetical protein BX663DRAFT_495407 [Cokeromyces recurvatus]
MSPITVSESVYPAKQGEGEVRRSVLSLEDLVDTPAQGVHTVYDVLQYSVKKRSEQNALGYRKLIQTITEEKQVTKMIDDSGIEVKQKKEWKYFQLSPYHYVTYAELSKIVHDIGSGLIYYGLKSSKSRIEIFSPTSMDWMSVAHGAFTQNMAVVTAYETLGADGLLHSMNEAQVDAVFTTAELLKTVASILSKCLHKSLLLIIYTGEAKEEDLASIHDIIGQEDRVITLDQLKKVGHENPKRATKPGRDDLCCIMYTSGSTGVPKGVILNHSNIVGAIAGVDTLLGHCIIGGEDTMMAYLPLAHVLEFLVENLCLFWGVTLGYGSPRTLTDISVRHCQGDIKEFKPSILTGVPAVWESIRKGVLNNVAKMSPTSQAIFHRAFTTKSWLMERGLSTGFLDSLIFNKIKEQVGGRLRYGLAGGAPVSLETQRFLSITLGPILNGFGMTESVGMCCIMTPDNFKYGAVGGPVPCCEIKLVDVPDANYVTTNPDKSQGEIWVRGSSIAQGYFKQDKLTKETFTEDGWLKTGDIGEWNPDGTLTIIDRIKNLVKLSHGEYIALEKLESIYKSTMGVNTICLYADSFSPRPIAIAMPIQAHLKQLNARIYDDNNNNNKSFKELCQDQGVKEAFLLELQQQAKKSGLGPAETIYDVYLTHEEWSPENGLLTAAQKLKRNVIHQHYREQLNAMNKLQKV